MRHRATFLKGCRETVTIAVDHPRTFCTLAHVSEDVLAQVASGARRPSPLLLEAAVAKVEETVRYGASLLHKLRDRELTLAAVSEHLPELPSLDSPIDLSLWDAPLLSFAVSKVTQTNFTGYTSSYISKVESERMKLLPGLAFLYLTHVKRQVIRVSDAVGKLEARRTELEAVQAPRGAHADSDG